MFKKIPAWVQLLVFSTIIVPLLVYVCGNWLVGEYEGSFGLIGFFFSIYRDAIQAKPAAWILLLAPLLTLTIWRVALRTTQYKNNT